jgi:hypothetical protein
VGNSNHDSLGRFSSGSAGAAATGDHLATQPANPALRNVSGRTVPRSKPVTRHAVQSVGTDKPAKVAPPWGTGRPAPGQAARDAVIRGKGIDSRAYPIRTGAGMGLDTTLQGGARTNKLNPRTHDTPATRAYLASIKRH